MSFFWLLRMTVQLIILPKQSSCAGNSTQNCGGSSVTAVALYTTIDAAPKTAASRPGYKGCFNDNVGARQLPGYSYTSTNMSIPRVHRPVSRVDSACRGLKAVVSLPGISLGMRNFFDSCLCSRRLLLRNVSAIYSFG